MDMRSVFMNSKHKKIIENINFSELYVILKDLSKYT